MATARPVELELKYRVADVPAAERLLDGQGLAGWEPAGAARTSQVEDRYVDTADGGLRRAGFAARLRHGSGGTLVTVKSLESTGRAALHRREELEGAADPAFPPHDWPASAARSLLLELAGDAPLLELVTVRQLRRVRPFRGGPTTIELSLDDVDVVARGRIVEHFTELEAELREGPADGLERLGESLDAVPWLAPSASSKLEVALAASIRPGGRRRGKASGADEARTADGDVRSRTQGVAEVAHAAAGAAEGAHAGADGAAEAEGGGPRGGPDGGGDAELGPEPPGAAVPLVVGKTPGVRAEDTLAEAGRKVLRFHLARMLAKEPGTRSGKDPEDLHAMRVATRRMRAAWRVFGEAYRPRREKRYVRDLRDVAARLGAVRDLDVLIDGLERYVTAQPEHERPRLAPLVDAWRQQREDARGLLLRTLDSDGYHRFVDEYREFVRTEGLGVVAVRPAEPHRVRDRMPTRIWSAYEQVRGYEPILRWADVETLHTLRIAAKRLRYTIEFVREPLGPEATPLIDRVVALQDHLGYLHDADVAAGLARQFLVDRSAELGEAETAAIGRFLVDRERELGRLRRTVGVPWRSVAGLAFRRALARSVAGL